MGDARHKKSKPDVSEEPITPEWRATVRERLRQNRLANKRNGLGPRHPDRIVDDYASLARAVGTDKTMIANILGAVRTSSKKKQLVERSVFVIPISEVLGVDPPTRIVDGRVATVAEKIARLSDGDFDRVNDMVNRLLGGTS